MTDRPARSVTASVEVPADCATAFLAFTEELDAWWLQGPINFFDATRARAMRMEPGVGGRILEVYEGDEGLELARIVEWAPPTRLAWESAVDDVRTTVSFEPTGGGTLVSVEAVLAAGGEDRGGTSWVRVVPAWFGRWVARRDRVPHRPETLSRLAVVLRYERPAAAARFVRDAFGLEPASRVPDTEPDDHAWFEFRVGDAAVVVLPREGRAVGHDGAATPWVFVDDLDEHYRRVKAAGATIEAEIAHHGARTYEAADLEGNRWTFAQASPRMRETV